MSFVGKDREKWTRLDVILAAIAWYTFVLGVVWRGAHLFYFHKATNFIYSDMSGYVTRAEGLVDRPGRERIVDTVNPPGAHIYFSYFYKLLPGITPSLAAPFRIDARWFWAILGQFVVSCSVPLVLYAAGKELYGRRVALVAMAICSVYFPFIHYSANFLSEGPFLFFLVLTLWLLAKSIRVNDGRWGAGFALAAGLALGVAAAMKPVVLLSALLIFAALLGAARGGRWLALTSPMRSYLIIGATFALLFYPIAVLSPYVVAVVQENMLADNVQQMVLTYLGPLAFAALATGLAVQTVAARRWELVMGLCFLAVVMVEYFWPNRLTFWGHSWPNAIFYLVPLTVVLIVSGRSWKRLPLVLAASAVGLTLVVVPLIARATRLNDNRLCLISNNSAVNMLLGHYGETRLFIFRDPKRGEYHAGCPVSYQKGYQQDVVVPYGAWDSKELVAMAWQWCKDHPYEALELSCLHVQELFYGTVPWPADHRLPWRYWFIAYHWVYLLLLLLPALVFLVMHRRELVSLEGTGLADMILILPLVGLMVVAFLSVGEPRFRVPFDVFIILLAARFYTWGSVSSNGLAPPAAAVATVNDGEADRPTAATAPQAT